MRRIVLGIVVRYVDRCPPVSSRSAVEEKVGRILRKSDGWAPFFGEPIWICRHCAGQDMETATTRTRTATTAISITTVVRSSSRSSNSAEQSRAEPAIWEMMPRSAMAVLLLLCMAERLRKGLGAGLLTTDLLRTY